MTMPRRHSRPTPDRDAALAQYRDRAGRYDLELAAFEPVRRRAIGQLGLTPGQTVLDVGCGTGLSFGRLREAVGEQGRIVGIEQCPEMLVGARARIARHGWANVTLEAVPTEEAAATGPLADAALFHFTHDILRRPEAIDRMLARLRPGATVVAAGLKWVDPWTPWAWPANLFVWSAALYSVTSLDGLEAPWSLLASRVERLQVEPALCGAAYVAQARVPG
jgi:SAM-dependent methyltransferase